MSENMSKLRKKHYVQITNQWFSVDSGQPFLALYSEKGLVLLIRMLQQISMRRTYQLSDYHIREWFSYSDYRSLKSVFAILQQFKDDKIVSFDGDYDFTNIYRGLIKFQPTSISSPSDKFFELYDYEIEAILVGYVGNIDKYKLLSLFACLKCHYNVKTKVCSPSFETLSSQTGLSENTIQSYLDVLVDLGLILYANPGTKLFPDGEVKECNNIYTMNYEGNKEILEQEVARRQQELAQQEKDKKLKVINGEIGKLKKSVKMRLNWLPKKLESGKITQAEHDAQYCELQEEYDRLVEEQKSLHNQ